MPIHMQAECTVGTRDITNICESVSGGSRKERLSTFAVLLFYLYSCIVAESWFLDGCATSERKVHPDSNSLKGLPAPFHLT